MRKLKVLVIGASGFLGKHVLGKAQEVCPSVAAMSRPDGLNLMDLECVINHLARLQPEIIFNCAAHVGSLHYVTSYAATVVHDNMQMALNLYRAVQQSCPEARIINPLSNCSYPGDADVHYEPDWWKGEVHPSVCAYGNSKRFIYVLAACYKKQHAIRSVNFLIPNAFGPGDYTDPNKTHALNGMIIRMLRAHRQGQSEFEIWGTGKPIREWAYIDDVAAILMEGVGFEADLIYPVNMAQNRGYSIGESARLIAEAIGFKGKLAFNPKYQDGAMRKILDDRQFRKLFPSFSFTDHEAGIRQTVAYYDKVLKN